MVRIMKKKVIFLLFSYAMLLCAGVTILIILISILFFKEWTLSEPNIYILITEIFMAIIGLSGSYALLKVILKDAT